MIDATGGRRLKLCRLHRSTLPLMFRARDFAVCVAANPMPDDARIVAVSEHESFGQDFITLKVESAAFPVVPEGAPIPMAPDVIFRSVSVD